MPNSLRFWIAWGQLVDAITNILLIGHGTQLSYAIARKLITKEQHKLVISGCLQ
jgi:hypothetical protein